MQNTRKITLKAGSPLPQELQMALAYVTSVGGAVDYLKVSLQRRARGGGVLYFIKILMFTA